MPLSICKFPENGRSRSNFSLVLDANRHVRCPPSLMRGFEFCVDIRSVNHSLPRDVSEFLSMLTTLIFRFS